MPPVQVGQWTNVEDQVLLAAVAKYGPQQWARVSSLLARKSAKQCKARYNERLAPHLKHTPFTLEEDQQLLHLAKLMPTQWRTMAQIMRGRTTSALLERYTQLIDEAESKERDELGLAGPAGEDGAPTADDVRKLRPGEVDPEPESRPARPDAVDMDEDEKEMLSEARARLANTQGKKAKRKARERQLEESRRLALLQKRRELKNAGINIRITNRKPGQMDYNADIPFEKAPAPGFYDTRDEEERNERQREAFDPRKQQLANKRKGEPDDDAEDRKRRKNEKSGESASFAAAQQAAKNQRIREAEQSSKRKALVLPAPQVSDAELEDIVKTGLAGDRATQAASQSENEATRGLVNDYSNVVGSTPIRTPRVAKEDDRIANEVHNARARTAAQSALLGGDNEELYEEGSTGFHGATPSMQEVATPNPLATPYRQAGAGAGATPNRFGPGSTPMRTPRDNFHLNEENGMQLAGQTPRDVRMREQVMRQNLQNRFAALPKPKESDWELELPEEQQEAMQIDTRQEDAAVRDRRNKELQQAAEKVEFHRQTQVVQKALPRPTTVDIDALLKKAEDLQDPAENAIAKEMAVLMTNDALKFGGAKVHGASKPLEVFSDDSLHRAKMEIALEVAGKDGGKEKFAEAWEALHGSSVLPGLEGYGEDEVDEHQLMAEVFDGIQQKTQEEAKKANAIEEKLKVHHKGYMNRAKMLREKTGQAAEALETARIKLETLRVAQMAEETALPERLEKLREEVAFVSRREREAQEVYRARKEELDDLQTGMNGYH